MFIFYVCYKEIIQIVNKCCHELGLFEILNLRPVLCAEFYNQGSGANQILDVLCSLQVY